MESRPKPPATSLPPLPDEAPSPSAQPSAGSAPPTPGAAADLPALLRHRPRRSHQRLRLLRPHPTRLGPSSLHLTRVAAARYNAGPHIPRPHLQPGDLLFFATNPTNPATIHHVGIYHGQGRMIHAPHTGDVVRTPEEATDQCGRPERM
ncbi:C40 family peptidase [Actinomadura spongiicola]|uniref:C40 family peptidase n=1 Tax=Actinomadura spongiicola TaxID=2303421 RepID=UPI0013146751|nr:NlpC/P60 family protein [Actinomadura spongiicola]